MTISVGITINNISYTPEAYAYERYLKKYGADVHLVQAHELDDGLDVHIYFMGLQPFWRTKGNWREIHEYQSLSTPNYSRFKDFLKKTINRKPDGRIFLNDIVENKMRFNDGIPKIYRDMGIDDNLFLPPPINPDFDLVYCGSIRQGLDEELMRLSKLGFKILVVGNVNADFIRQVQSFKNIELAGPAKREELPSLYQCARAGFNYTPNIYPFNVQTSTKVLEYCAAGLGVVSNRYQWSEFFCTARNGRFLWLDDLIDKSCFDNFDFGFVSVNDLRWDEVLKKSNFEKFVCDLG